jgi:hypothetical protein
MHYCLVEMGRAISGDQSDPASAPLRGSDVFILLSLICLTVFHPGVALRLRDIDARMEELEGEKE